MKTNKKEQHFNYLCYNVSSETRAISWRLRVVNRRMRRFDTEKFVNGMMDCEIMTKRNVCKLRR